MSMTRSRLTAQGQISVPAAIRKRLGIGPGSVIEWEESGGEIVVRRSGRYDSGQIHSQLFGTAAPEPHSLDELKSGIREHVRKRHAGG
jgi:AbrB family looped-hinge helix DNA binding protein